MKRMNSEEIYKRLLVADIRDSTKAQYAKRLRQLESICGVPILKILQTPDESIKKLRSAPGLTTSGARANAVAVLLSVFKHCSLVGEVGGISQKIRERWSELHALEQIPASLEFASGSTKTLLKWSRVFDKNAELYAKAFSKGATREDVSDALLSSFYVDIEPRRQEDYMRLYVVTRNSHNSPETSYVDMTLPDPVLHVDSYKTSSSLKPWSRVLPPKLVKLLVYSLELSPREYVFVGRDSEAYKTPGAWAKHHNNKLSKWFGPGANVLGLRHARATSISQDSRYSAQERERLALDMGHRTTTNMAYAQIEDSQEEQDGTFRITRFDKSSGRFVEYGCTPLGGGDSVPTPPAKGASRPPGPLRPQSRV